MKWLLKLLPIQFKIWLYKLLYNDIAEKGEAEDTELAHINAFEAQLLKRVGGLGKKNPITGLRGFLGGGGGGGPAPAPAPSQPEKTTQITREAPEIEARKLALFDEAIELGYNAYSCACNTSSTTFTFTATTVCTSLWFSIIRSACISTRYWICATSSNYSSTNA